MQHTQRTKADAERAAPATEVLAGNDALAALIAGWRAGWRRQLEWCPLEALGLETARFRAYQQRMIDCARQVQELLPNSGDLSLPARWRNAHGT